MEPSLATLASDRRPAKLAEQGAERIPQVLGRCYIDKTPKLQGQTAEASLTRAQSANDEQVTSWGKAMRRKTGPKSARPFWEAVLGRAIPDQVWSSAMKQTQFTRGAKPITKEDLLRRIARMEANA